MNGYAGKILRVNLSDRRVSTIDTREYGRWVGGHGMGSAIFFDLCKDKTIDGFDERNVITIMTSPLTGTLAPGGASRTEVQGIGVHSHPVGWFTRSNVGGRFGAMLKAAGWDGIVIEGKADSPVWLDVRDGEVKIRDARSLWGRDTRETQQDIWKQITGSVDGRDWTLMGDPYVDGRTTQKPAVLAIGPAGENLARVAAIIHDAGNAAGQGGFGAVWGSKNLKAVSVIGTGSVRVADPEALLEARLWAKKNYSLDVDDPAVMNSNSSVTGNIGIRSLASYGSAPVPIVFWKRDPQSRPQGCVGCPSGCRSRYSTGLGNESGCAETALYTFFDVKRHGGPGVKILSALMRMIAGNAGELASAFLTRKPNTASYKVTDLAQKLGINAFELMIGLPYLRDLFKMGELGPGKAIDCPLDFKKIGDEEFGNKLLNMIANREGIGDDIAEGLYRAAERWGRLPEDSESGLLRYAYWGLPDHYDPRFQVEWGYGSVLGDRDINEHGFNMLFWMPTAGAILGGKPFIEAEEAAKIFSDKMEPFQGDPSMIDYSTDNIYSDKFAKLVAWHRHYTRFWKQSALYCDFLFPDFMNAASPDKRGMVGQAEQKFFNAVTGKDMSFADGIETGRRIWNLDNAVWTLQGRHRDMVAFSPYIYDQPFKGTALLPGRKKGKWKYINARGRRIEKDKFEQWKTKYYKLEGWDPETGWPRRKTLESMAMNKVADELEKKQKLGRD
jgi:aldehyde:ferredoxin oxidoreductase